MQTHDEGEKMGEITLVLFLLSVLSIVGQKLLSELRVVLVSLFTLQVRSPVPSLLFLF